ncbi:ribosomal-protein-alanine N-acetyltransferase [Saccharopolyspora flava]|uniref:Ribosomal-protein-alanine N-acetyltransferase n=1 Tax=Saccharopolyspora flava TaxID=95161 RepID=A0A1I6PS99_9PSEU|nr:ribosomal-protein-alanine N-acetyltransferase [Saccharopolyspora flava]
MLKLRRSDLRRCAELEQVLFAGDDPWSRAAFSAELDQGHHYVGAYLDERLIGYAGLAVNGRPPHVEAEVHTIGVDPEHQGEGVGKALLRALLRRADEHRATTFLEVRTDNEAAIGMYRAHGFEIVGLRPRYYQPSGADAHTMRREAAGAPQGTEAS